jgi:transposase
LLGRIRSERKKKAALLERLRALPKSAVVLFEDETLLREFPPLRCAWAKRGEQAVVAITGNNARRTLFGALNPRTGTRLLLKRLRNRAGDFQAFLRYVRSKYRRWDIVMILDKASAHTAKATQKLAEELRITFEWLPTASPELNPKELLWRHGKDRISANRVYEKVDEQADAFVDHLLSLSNQQALRTAGVLSKNFWLAT